MNIAFHVLIVVVPIIALCFNWYNNKNNSNQATYRLYAIVFSLFEVVGLGWGMVALATEYTLFVYSVAIVLVCYIARTMWGILNGRDIRWQNFAINLALLIVGCVAVGGGVFISGAKVRNVIPYISHPVQSENGSVGAVTDWIRPFEVVSENGFSVYIDRSLVNVNDSVVIERLKDIARYCGNQPDDSQYGCLYVGGRIVNQKKGLRLIAGNGESVKLKYGLVFPIDGNINHSRRGLAIKRPGDITVVCHSDTLRIDGDDFWIAVDQHGSVSYGGMDFLPNRD